MGRQVTRPALCWLSSAYSLDAVASVSTTTLNSWLPAVTSTAVYSLSEHSNRSMTGPCTPLSEAGWESAPMSLLLPTRSQQHRADCAVCRAQM